MPARMRDLLFRGIPDVCAEALGLYRLVFASLLAAIVVTAPISPEPLPRELHHQVSGLADWSVFHWLVTRPDLVAHWETALVILLAFFAVGFLTRLALVLATIAFVGWVILRMHHSGVHDWAVLIPALVGVVPVRWGDAFSIDEMIRRWRGRGGRAGHGRYYGFGIWLPGFVIGIAFAAAAAAKLRQSGFAWVVSGAVKYHFVTDARAAVVRWGLWIAAHHWAAVVFSFLAIWVEATVIVASFLKRAWLRFLFGIPALFLLAGFYLLQHELWLAWWILTASFLPWNGIFKVAARLLPSAIVLIDGRCPLCRRTARILHGLDWFNRLEFADANDDVVRERLVAGLTREMLVREMHVFLPASSQLRTGYRAYLALARALPVIWLVLPVAALPPVPWFGERLYARVAKSRHREAPCSEQTCALHRMQRTATTELPAVAAHAVRSAALRPVQIAAIVAVAALQVIASVLRVEIEPWMSDYPMYAQTYASIEEFERQNPIKRVHHFRHDPVDAAPEDISQALDDMPDADLVIIEAVKELLTHGVLSPARQQQVQAVAAAFQRRTGRPLDRVTVLVSEEAFDWQRGRFYWKTVGSRLGTLDARSFRLAKSGEE